MKESFIKKIVAMKMPKFANHENNTAACHRCSACGSLKVFSQLSAITVAPGRMSIVCNSGS